MTSDLPPIDEESLPPPPSPEGPEAQEHDAGEAVEALAQPAPIWRSKTDRYLAGVAGGLGERFNFDPFLARIAFVAMAIFAAYAETGLHPLVLIPYVAAWALVPPEGGRSLFARIREREAAQELAGAVVLLAIGLLVLSDSKYALAIGLAAAAAALFSDRTANSETDDSDDETPPSGLMPSDPKPSGGATKVSTVPRVRPSRHFNLSERAAGIFDARRPRRAKREPALWPLTLSLLVLLGIVGILIDRFTDPGMDPGVAVNLALLAIGSVLVLSLYRGRAKVTILWAILLLPLWVGFSVTGVDRFAGEGNVRHTPTEATGSLDYEIGYGDLRIDLREYDFAPGSETTMTVGVTAGSATIWVPRDVSIRVVGKVGLGNYAVRHPWYWSPDKLLANGKINRTYEALGQECDHWEVAANELPALARNSGIELGNDADVIEAIAAAGFDRPQLVYTSQIEEPFVNADGATEFRFADVEIYSVPSGRNGTLCRPEPPPANPAVLVIEPTLGIGTLEVQRVDIG